MTQTAWFERYYSSGDGLRLHYRDYPAGSDAPRLPVVCLPGLTRNCRDFEALALRMRSSRRVLSPDLRGRGLSQYDPQWRNYHPGTYLGDLARLFEDAGVERVVLVGTSLGGILSMLLASIQPQRIAGVVLNDIGPEIATEGLQRIASYVGRNPPVRSWDEAVEQVRATSGFAMPDATDDELLAHAHRAYREIDGRLRLDMDPMIGEAVRAASLSQAPDLWAAFASLGHVPMLAIRGALSDVMSAATLARMAREKPDLEQVTVPNRGHPPLLDEPECIAAIDAFLERLP